MITAVIGVIAMLWWCTTVQGEDIAANDDFVDGSLLSIEDAKRVAAVQVFCFDSDGRCFSNGSACFLWCYVDSNDVYMLTAKHVLESAKEVRLRVELTVSAQRITTESRPIRVRDTAGADLFWSPDNGYDIALLRLPKIWVFPDVRLLAFYPFVERHHCLLTGDCAVGTELMAFGYADTDTFFTGAPASGFMARAGVLSWDSGLLYFMGEETMPGMSGGPVFERVTDTRNPTYRLVGTIWGDPRAFDDFGAVCKLHWVDSLVIQNEGVLWGTRK